MYIPAPYILRADEQNSLPFPGRWGFKETWLKIVNETNLCLLTSTWGPPYMDNTNAIISRGDPSRGSFFPSPLPLPIKVSGTSSIMGQIPSGNVGTITSSHHPGELLPSMNLILKIEEDSSLPNMLLPCPYYRPASQAPLRIEYLAAEERTVEADWWRESYFWNQYRQVDKRVFKHGRVHECGVLLTFGPRRGSSTGNYHAESSSFGRLFLPAYSKLAPSTSPRYYICIDPRCSPPRMALLQPQCCGGFVWFSCTFC